jgi:SpoVK/Ycf46/Vps4 family AAA+-type ATPase
MIVDPATGSAEILNGNGKARDKKTTKKLPPVELPVWFNDCVTWPDATAEMAPKKQVAFLPSQDRNITGMSFLSESDRRGEDGKETEQNLEDANRIWLDPLLFTEIDGVIRTSLELPETNGKDTPLSLRSTISLHCPLEGGMPLLNDIAEHIVSTQGAGLLRLNAQDLAELGGSYVCPDAGLDVSLQTLPFDAYSEGVEEIAAEEQEITEEDETAASEDEDPRPNPPKAPQVTGMWLSPTVIPLQGGNIGDAFKKLLGGQFSQANGAGNQKRGAKASEKIDEDIDVEPLMDEERLDKFLNALIDGAWARHSESASKGEATDDAAKPKLIICLDDLIRLSQTAIGIELVEKLAEVIRQRRSQRGERLVLVGLSIDTELLSSQDPEKTIQWETDHSIWRTMIVIPHAANGNVITSRHQALHAAHSQRNAQINLRNWYTTAAQMAPSLMPERVHILQPENKGLGHAIGLSRSVWTRDEIQRLATASIARVLTQKRDKVGLDDLVAAAHDNRVIDVLREGRIQTLRDTEALENGSNPLSALQGIFNTNIDTQMPLGFGSKDTKTGAGSSDVSARLQALQREADRYEKKLINGVVLPEKINTTFSDVHVAKATVEAVRDLTALSLQRPDAFKYGVLATNTLSGLLLYGPPGTGKTMLAKAVAKESSAAVLTVTGSDVNQMWVGESEKTVKAIFTLARKLSPCVVFIDEADALLASRGSDGRGGRPNHRDTINQFLLEWDGMNESGVFLMVATNRPFDLDDAVLRRLPRRVLVDLPTKDDREAILRIHLKGETLSDAVSLADLATKTPYYSGSDLKNVCVSAALAAVRDELEAKKAAEAKGEEYTFPEKRVLEQSHFEKAMGEVGSSVSADMSSLRAVKKFDEQYGERRGRRKKNPFGLGRAVEREEDARVRA